MRKLFHYRMMKLRLPFLVAVGFVAAWAIFPELVHTQPNGPRGLLREHFHGIPVAAGEVLVPLFTSRPTPPGGDGQNEPHEDQPAGRDGRHPALSTPPNAPA